jgi:hypothetical protein
VCFLKLFTFASFFLKLVGADKKEIDSKTNLALALTAGGMAGLLACPFFTLKVSVG